jgi:phosphoribosylglycinamide formyltransferase 1
MRRMRVAILISGRGSNMAALIRAAQDADFPAEITLVLANVPGAGGLKIAQAAGIPTLTLDHKPYGKDRAAYDAAMQKVLEAHSTELVCLAGFMRILSPGFCEAWAGRMLNIHPSLLPAFKGLDTHARALAAGVTEHGCTVHFVTPGLDEGPTILQARVQVLSGDTEETLAARVLAEEHRIYPEALKRVIEELQNRFPDK